MYELNNIEQALVSLMNSSASHYRKTNSPEARKMTDSCYKKFIALHNTREKIYELICQISAHANCVDNEIDKGRPDVLQFNISSLAVEYDVKLNEFNTLVNEIEEWLMS